MFTTGHGDCADQSRSSRPSDDPWGSPPVRSAVSRCCHQRWTATCGRSITFPGYGWISAGLTAGSSGYRMNISDGARKMFQEYYSNSLDPSRFVIQKGLDRPMDPVPSQDDSVTRIAAGYPMFISDTSGEDLDLISAASFGVNLSLSRSEGHASLFHWNCSQDRGIPILSSRFQGKGLKSLVDRGFEQAVSADRIPAGIRALWK